MRYAALDIGDKRIGVALSDASGRVASPHSVLDTRQLLAGGKELRQIFEDYEVEHLVIGLPLTLSGEEGSQARHVKALAEKVLKACSYLADDESALGNDRVTFYDERLSSVAAKQSLADADYSEKQMRGKVDKIAAALFLQSFLDTQCL